MTGKRKGHGLGRSGGRPPLGAASLSEQIVVRVTSAVHAKIVAACERAGLSEPDWARESFARSLARGDSAQVRTLKARVAELEADLAASRAQVQAIADMIALPQR